LLTDVSIKGGLNGSLTNFNVQMSYINGDFGSPIEPTFEFRLKDDGKFSVNYLSAVIGDEMIEAQIT